MEKKPHEHATPLDDRAKELGLPDPTKTGFGPAIVELAERVAKLEDTIVAQASLILALEQRLNTLQRATAHITSIPPIGG